MDGPGVPGGSHMKSPKRSLGLHRSITLPHHNKVDLRFGLTPLEGGCRNGVAPGVEGSEPMSTHEKHELLLVVRRVARQWAGMTAYIWQFFLHRGIKVT